jgi:hypothetical protein
MISAGQLDFSTHLATEFKTRNAKAARSAEGCAALKSHVAGSVCSTTQGTSSDFLQAGSVGKVVDHGGNVGCVLVQLDGVLATAGLRRVTKTRHVASERRGQFTQRSVTDNVATTEALCSSAHSSRKDAPLAYSRPA